jgi:hypothetical protein
VAVNDADTQIAAVGLAAECGAYPVSEELVSMKCVHFTNVSLREVLRQVARARLTAPLMVRRNVQVTAACLAAGQRISPFGYAAPLECRPGISPFPIRADCTPRHALE